MFRILYELLCGRNIDPTYATDIYPTVGLFTLIGAAIGCAVFYLALGRWRPIFDKLVHWIISVVLIALIAGILALRLARGAIGGDDYDSYMVKFSMVNGLYAAIFFVLLSLMLKKASIFAKRTPF